MTPHERAIDEELVCAHLGCVCENDSFEDAKRKLRELIKWHVDIATDERVNGGYRLVRVDSPNLSTP